MPENEPLSTAAEPEPEATEPQPEPEQEQEAEPKDDDALGRTSSSKPASAASLSQPSMAAATLPPVPESKPSSNTANTTPHSA